MKTLSVSGKIDEQGQLSLDQPIKSDRTGEVRVIIVFPDTELEEAKKQEQKKSWDEKVAEYKKRKLMPTEQFCQEFKQAFVEAGYDSEEKIMQLIQEVKKEMADEVFKEILKTNE
jgi:fructose-specific phosphotransferase system component IIB